MANKTKFKSGDLVIDITTGIMGVIDKHVGHGTYGLKNLRMLCRRLDYTLDSIPVDIGFESPDADLVTVGGYTTDYKGYIQYTKCISFVQPEQEAAYYRGTSLDSGDYVVLPGGHFNSNTILKYDNEHIISPITATLYGLGGYEGCHNSYVISAVYHGKYWNYAGSIKSPKSVCRRIVDPEYMFQIFNSCSQPTLLLNSDDVDVALRWFDEYAPFVIDGVII